MVTLLRRLLGRLPLSLAAPSDMAKDTRQAASNSYRSWPTAACLRSMCRRSMVFCGPWTPPLPAGNQHNLLLLSLCQGGKPDHIAERSPTTPHPLESFTPASLCWLHENRGKHRCDRGCATRYLDMPHFAGFARH